MKPDAQERDWLAELWVRYRHGPDWYIGNASTKEWAAAYDAVDAGWRPLDPPP